MTIIDVLFYHPTKVYQAQSMFSIISLSAHIFTCISQKLACLSYLPEFGLGFASTHFREVSHLVTGVSFFLNVGEGFLQRVSTPNLLHKLLLLLAVKLSFDSRRMFLKLYKTSIFTLKGLLLDEELGKATA